MATPDSIRGAKACLVFSGTRSDTTNDKKTMSIMSVVFFGERRQLNTKGGGVAHPLQHWMGERDWELFTSRASSTS